MFEIHITLDCPAVQALADAILRTAGTDLVSHAAQTVSQPAQQPQQTQTQVAPAQTDAPVPPAQPAAAPAPVATSAPEISLEAVMKAAADLRYEGKLGQITALFPKYGIQKLSDLAGHSDKILSFAAEMREMGARIA
jgi:hypothetical protein